MQTQSCVAIDLELLAFMAMRGSGLEMRAQSLGRVSRTQGSAKTQYL
jgi:hypothetical protein